jgi:hypothetical protein
MTGALRRTPDPEPSPLDARADCLRAILVAGLGFAFAAAVYELQL